MRFSGADWKRLVHDPDHRPDTWSTDLVRSYRRRHEVLASAENRDDLMALRCLDFRTEPGPSGSQASIRILGDVRLLLEFDAEKPDEVMVVGLVRSDTQEVAR